jgi:membrane-associated protease RseP (regulator of RpoE activity)
MKRCIVITLVLMATGIWPSPARHAAAQPVLQRLEDQIRQQGGEGSAPAVPESRPLAAPSAGLGAAAARERPYLGAVADDRNDRGRGVRIVEVRPNGPADKAGLRVGDLVVGAAGQRVRQMSDLTQILDLFAVGDKLSVELVRDTVPQKAEVTLGARPATAGAAAMPLPEAVPAPRAEQPPPLPGEPPRLQPPAGGPNLTPPPLPGPLTSDSARIEQLQRRIDQLERRIEELERALLETRKKP